MDIYTDYGNWKFENHEFISQLVSCKSKTISRFTPVIAVVDYIYEMAVEHKTISSDEELIFSTGFDYIYDQFHFIQTILELKFNNNYKELEKFSKTINLLLYINDFENEALEQKDLNTKDFEELGNLKDKVTSFIDKKENAPDEYFALLNDISNKLFEQKGIEIHTIDQIFYEIALEYNIYHEDDYDLYTSIINKKIEKDREQN